MKRDVGGWVTRLDDEMVARYTARGQWSGITLARCAFDRANDMPNRIAVVDGAAELTFKSLLSRALQLLWHLRDQGLRSGDVVSFQLPNWHEAMVINLAVCLGGFICNPIVAIYRDAEVGFILRDSRSRMLFIPENFRGVDYVAMMERIKPGLPDLRDVVLVRGRRSGFSSFDAWVNDSDVSNDRAAKGPSDEVIDPNAIKMLLYTSGTTGNPKGVLHSHNTIRAEIEAITQFWEVTASDVVLMASPVTHITGYLYALELAFSAGIKAVFMDRWNAETAINLVSIHGVTFSIGATPFLVEIVEATESHGRGMTLPSLRLFACGGTAVPPEIIQRAGHVLPNCKTFRIFGCTEAPTISAGLGKNDPIACGATTDGRILNHEVRIVDTENGRVMPSGAEGEILTRGPEVMLGYTNLETTADAFDVDGFFKTGDLGFVSSDGFITISGRKKDLIIRGGENISPKEIEDVLHRHPAIQEVSVVAMPHSRMGETPAAYVILRPGASLSLDGLKTFLEEAKLARQKFPERLVVVEDFPRTASGKVLKHVLRARIVEEASILR